VCGSLIGMSDDPFKYSDNLNRGLWDLHIWLGPGRYASETLLDVCVLLGFARGEEVIDDNAVAEESVEPMKLEIVTLKVNRFEE
jgi:hypothetical protein